MNSINIIDITNSGNRKSIGLKYAFLYDQISNEGQIWKNR